MTVRTKIAAMTAALTVVISLVGAGSASAAEPIATEAPAAVAAGPAAPTDIVKAADLSKFNPGNIVSDAVFFNKSTMSEAQIQAFLEKRVPSCQAGYTCLKDWYDTSRTTTADAMCGAYSGGTRERAARIIFKVAQACGINPQVILVTLQKEQGLVTHTWPSDWRYTIAMGQGCPDTAACDTRYYGFFNQVYGAAWQMKRYANPPGTSQFFTWYAPGKTWNILFNPNHGCGTSPVYVQNQATSNLYYYTPYQPNAAAIRAGYGEGDGCSAYGNRNFFNYFTDWFGSTQSSSPCAVPAGTGSASWTYVTVSATTARTAPNSSCTTGAAAIETGAIVKALATTADDQWRKVRTTEGDLWVPRDALRQATSQESPCAHPAGIGSASWTYTVTTATQGRAAPTTACAATVELPAGAVAKAVATSKDGQWRQLRTVDGDVWVPLADLRASTSGELACITPTGTGPASWTYTVAVGTTGRTAPAGGCAEGAVSLSTGTTAKAVATSADGLWRLLETTEGRRWALVADLRRATADEAACAAPIGTAPASWTYVTQQEAVARSAPDSACSLGATTVPAGAVGVAVATSADGEWRKLTIAGTARWLALADLRQATAQDIACAVPTSTRSASWTFVATVATTGRSVPSHDCAAGETALPAGTLATAIGASDDLAWRLLRTDTGDVWVPVADLRRATAADTACTPAVGTTSATWTYVTSRATTARTAPNALCAEGAVSLPAGTIAKAIAASADGAWRLLQTATGDRWILMADISHVRTTTTASVNLRTSPSTSATSLATLAKGTTVVIVGSSGAWREVTAGTRQGWVHSDYLK
ncbi:SH3 domain-containing protein [Microbacterium sp. Marseille-Q6648]|uniref:SH3 domain-containing protein n=1 Tax=Microbacterium sp. Marseille-Q6648 TaxID=2937991 RepID=UPI002041D087|nr:SH3 domain-containing protein [Microbacterium sp. Marseille-Q6648]